MTADIADALEERWAEFLRLLRQGANYSAHVRLGEIANCLRHAPISEGERTKWSDKLSNVEVSPATAQSIRDELREKLAWLDRMITVGGTLAFEEAVVVITLRVELEMLLTYLADRGISDRSEADTLDSELLELMRERENAGTFRKALRAAANNWGLPLRSKWLDLESVHVAARKG